MAVLVSATWDPTLPLRNRVLPLVLETAEVTASPTAMVDVEARDGNIISTGSPMVKPNPLSRGTLLAAFAEGAFEDGEDKVLLDRMLGDDNLLDNPRSLAGLDPSGFGASDDDEGERGTEGEPSIE